MRKLIVLLLTMLLLAANLSIVAAVEPDVNLAASQSIDLMEAQSLDVYNEITTASGITYVPGFWVSSDIDDFCLGRRTEKVSFWLEEAPSKLSVQIKLVEEEENTLGETIYKLDEDDLKTGILSKRSKACKVNLSKDYYTINLKVKDMPLLEDGKTYVIVIMAGDKIVSLDGEDPAMLTFTVSNDVQYMRKNIKMELQRCGVDKIPKYNRCNFRE